MDHIKLSTKKELEIYMNPVRQNLLRLLERSKLPMTPKQLSLKLDISPSSVQHHIKKLESLGSLRWTIQRLLMELLPDIIVPPMSMSGLA